MGKSRKRKNPHSPKVPEFTGDHGTGTKAATDGTVLEAYEPEPGKKDPNGRGRRRRIEVIDELKFLSQRQYQAAREIRDAYCAVDSLSSGDALKESVDSSPKPDACIARQVDAMSRLQKAMKNIPSHMRLTVEEICWNNRPIRRATLGYEIARSDMQGAMSIVADHLGY